MTRFASTRLTSTALIAIALGGAACSHRPRTSVAPTGPSPILPLLDQFVGPNIPALGPAEPGPTERKWPTPTTPPPAWPGKGIAQHPMLYVGEGYNTLFLVKDGQVIWNYSTGKGGEIDDVWLMSNGHILFARQHDVQEVTPQKRLVWRFEAPQGTEIHSCQPLGLDKVLLIQNGLPPKLMVVDKASNKIEIQHEMPAVSLTDPKTVHPQFRRIRKTAAGTYLAPFLKMGKVVEYDADFKEIWSYAIPTPWAAVRLHNGNTLIADEHDKLVREVSPKGETVWEFSQADIPAPSPSGLPANIVLHNIQTAERLANGNTVIFSSTGGTKQEDRPNIIQILEVTPDKKVVWVLQDWKNLGPATTAQFLDQPGIPERPGDLQR